METNESNFIPVLTSPMSAHDATQLNPLVLAFVGDGVQTLYVRTKNVFSGDFKAGALHRLVSSEIRATAQSQTARELMPLFTEEEQDIYRRARNAKVHTAAKNASIGEYKSASGLEAVFGYLYLTGQHARLTFLLEKGRA